MGAITIAGPSESSNPANVGLYERFGFEVVAELRLGDDGPVVLAMWRPGING